MMATITQTKTIRKSITMAPPSPRTNASSYYAGSTEIAQETPITLNRLEPRRKLTKNSTRLVIVLVGLPARGKSFVARKLHYYMNWSGCKCEIFNVGRYRRQAMAELSKRSNQDIISERDEKGACDASFFDAKNQAAAELRQKVAEMALLDMLAWLDDEDEEYLSDGEENADASRNSLNNGGRRASDSSRSLKLGQAKLDFKRYDRIAIFDATNSTVQRRKWILEQCTSPVQRPDKQTGVIFVESICDDRELLEENYRYKISQSPDFDGMSEEEAFADLRQRVLKYENAYETITDDSLSYIKIFNLSTKLMVNHIYGRMAKELIPALMAWHIGTRPVFLCRPGQTSSGIYTDGEDYVSLDKINMNHPSFLDLSSRAKQKNVRGDGLGRTGVKFRQELLDFCYEEAHSFMYKRASVHDMAYTGTSISGLAPAELLTSVGSHGNYDKDHVDDSLYAEPHDHKDPFPLKIMTSTMPRALETVNWEEYEFSVAQMSNLNPLDKGDGSGMELEEVKKINPAWYEKLVKDPYNTRFPGGESYRDLIRRLVPVVIDIEQQVSPCLVVSHVSILQCLMAYFRNSPVEHCMSIEVPMHTVIKFTPVRGGGWIETQHPLCEAAGLSMRQVDSTGDLSTMSNGGSSSPLSPIWGDHLMAQQRTSLKQVVPVAESLQMAF
ncbi:hypothetical protein MPSEU_000805400 [Mayamaea pseudoterrestris]|nr:hypothetical protein MPSEU_000805400 [Mayamaea pseudoterrestris]